MKKNGTKTSSKLNQKIKQTSAVARAELSREMKQVVEDSVIAKAQAHTAAFKMIRLNPQTYKPSTTP
jgi:hypothetical protein